MNTKLQKVVVWGSVIMLTVMLGCASFQDALTPCYIPPETLEYTDAPATTFFPFTTLFDAKRVDFKLDYTYTLQTMKYKYLKGIGTFHRIGAEELQASLFSPEGPIGLLLPTIFGGTLGALLIKRPQDTNGNGKRVKKSTKKKV
ncbi:MAG TPA: hypothetical protein ENI23_02855 [bacterium]|nr:hypothetical protein [bacterium]